MFSSITMASSTTKPVAMVSAIRLRLLMEKSSRYITPNVPTSDSGTTTLGISVAEALRRNRKVTITTSATANSSSFCTSRTDARMLPVRSVRMATSVAAGMVAVRRGSSSCTRSATSMTLAPGWRCTLTSTAGRRSAHAAR
jgi:hypothetical protein